MVTNNPLKGTIHGKMIELEHDLGIPDGSEVAVLVRALSTGGDGSHKAFGGWAGEDAELDEFLAQVRRDRQRDHRKLR